MKLNFPDEYFKEEVRDGFTISAEMKHAWAASLKVFAQFDDICQQYGLRYFALFGTLLGTVRDKGFIAWDDDLDIGMMREDLTKFEHIAADVLPEGLHFVSYQTMEGYDSIICRVTNGVELHSAEEPLKRRMDEYYGCPYVVGIDLYPIDYMPEGEDRAMQQEMLSILETCRQMCKNENVSIADRRYIDVQVEKMFKTTIDERKSPAQISSQITKLQDALSAMYGPEDTDRLGLAVNNCDFGPGTFDILKTQPFECVQMPVIAGYDDFLRVAYGDYMKKVNKAAHSYPFYKGQKKILEDAGYISLIDA